MCFIFVWLVINRFVLPSSSSESIALDEPRFQRKLRKGLFERVRDRRPILNEPPLLDVNGSVDDNGVDRLCSKPLVSIATHILILNAYGVAKFCEIHSNNKCVCMQCKMKQTGWMVVVVGERFKFFAFVYVHLFDWLVFILIDDNCNGFVGFIRISIDIGWKCV